MSIEVFRSELQVLFTVLIASLTGETDVGAYEIRQDYSYEQFLVVKTGTPLFRVSTYVVLSALKSRRPIPVTEVIWVTPSTPPPAPVELTPDQDLLDPFELRSW